MTYLLRSVVTSGVLFAIVCAPSVVWAAAPAGGATASAKPGASPTAPAVTALLKEYQAAVKSKDGKGLREKSDYFAQNKAEGLTPEVILATLEKPVSTDPRAEAYVKWQLLSGVDGKFPENLKPRVIRVYRSAPVPRSHPGFDHPSLERTLYRIGINNKDAEVEVNKEFMAAVEQYRDYVEPILAYRDELYARLSPGYDTLVAGVQDTYDRVSHGAPATEFWKVVSSAIRQWALTSSDAGQMRTMASAIGKLNGYVKDERNKPFYRVMWVNEGKYTGLKWQSQSTINNEGKYVGDLGEWLSEHANNPSGAGLQFKDDQGDEKKMKKK
ncbi:MAG TPA: hypothetical protein VH475_09320 [Tepidisphaeraceae bacterium]|jgi:hypothetical protein